MMRIYCGAIFAALLAACSAPEGINISGSSTVLPAVSRAAETYSAKTDLPIIVNAGGSGSGFNQLAEGQTDLAMMSRDITADERENFSAVNFTEIAIGRDAVIPSISSEIFDTGVTALTLSQIASIYSGEVDNWAAFGGPDQPIFAVDKEASRGTRQIFMGVVMGDSKALAPGADLVTGSNNEEQTALVQSDAAIGMLSFAWLNKDVRGLSIVLENGQVIEPTLDNIRSGAYPFVRDLNLVKRGELKPSAQKFIDYMLGPDGQEAVAASGYIKVSE